MDTLLIKNAHVFAPEDLGICDVLCWGDRILDVGRDLWPPGEPVVVQAEDRPLLPGLVDTHIHIMGASGAGGPDNRTPDMPLSWMTLAGITTVVSPLGTDSLSRSIPALLARAARSTSEGVSAYVYTGGWRNPVPTLTGDPQADVAFIDAVLGIKVAVAEPGCPPFTIHDLASLAQAAVIGGGIGGKHAVLHAHIGDRSEGLTPLRKTVDATGLPADRFVATHVNRNPALWEMAQGFARDGGGIDMTSQVQQDRGYANAVEPDRAVLHILDSDLPRANITISSDAGGAYPRPPTTRKGTYTMAEPMTLFETLQKVVSHGASWADVAPLATKNAADRLGLTHKGRIAPGADADLLLLSEENEVDNLWSRGRLMVTDGEPVVRSDYE